MRRKLLLATLLTAGCCNVHAAPEFKLSGFGTLGVAHSNNRDADFIEVLKDTGPGKTRATDFGLDTMAAVQLNGQFSEEWSAVVQVLSARNADGNFEPRVEWANLKYAVTPELSLRAGRVGLPIFMASEFRQVNYGNLWVRGPVEVYNLVPVSTVDGANVNYLLQLGGGTLNLRGCYAQTSLKNSNLTATGSDTLTARKVASFAARYERGPFTVRGSYTKTQAEYTLQEVAPMIDGLRMLATLGVPGARPLLDTTLSSTNHLVFSGLGASYDGGRLILQGEYMQRSNSEGLVNQRKAAYLLGGLRMGKLTPYAIHSRDWAKGPYTSSDADRIAAFAPNLGTFAPQVVALANAVQQGFALRSMAQASTSLGVRYDIMPNAAIKTQFDRIRPSGATLTGAYPQSAKPTSLVSLAFDFIY